MGSSKANAAQQRYPGQRWIPSPASLVHGHLLALWKWPCFSSSSTAATLERGREVGQDHCAADLASTCHGMFKKTKWWSTATHRFVMRWRRRGTKKLIDFIWLYIYRFFCSWLMLETLRVSVTTAHRRGQGAESPHPSSWQEEIPVQSVFHVAFRFPWQHFNSPRNNCRCHRLCGASKRRIRYPGRWPRSRTRWPARLGQTASATLGTNEDPASSQGTRPIPHLDSRRTNTWGKIPDLSWINKICPPSFPHRRFCWLDRPIKSWRECWPIFPSLDWFKGNVHGKIHGFRLRCCLKLNQCIVCWFSPETFPHLS